MATKQQLVSRASTIARERLDSVEADMFHQFLQQVIHVHFDATQLSWSAEENFASLYGLFQQSIVRKGKTPVIKVFNPQLKTDSWSNPHTVIYICQLDMPFLVDSVRIALDRMDINTHLFQSNQVWLQRDHKGTINSIDSVESEQSSRETFIFILIGHHSGTRQLNTIKSELKRSLRDLVNVFSDFKPMLKRINDNIDALSNNPNVDPEEVKFLHWLRSDNFTFLGMADYRLRTSTEGTLIEEDESLRLGLMRKRASRPPVLLSDLPDRNQKLNASQRALIFTRSSYHSTVHRDVLSDYVIINKYDGDKLLGETRILGLYRALLHHHDVYQVPLVRKKANWLMRRSQLERDGHGGKIFNFILQGHLREELIQSTPEELLATLLEVWKIYEHKAVKLFIRRDSTSRFISCIIYLPRNAVSTGTRRRIEQLLEATFNSEIKESSLNFLIESALARIYLVFRASEPVQLDLSALETQIQQITRDWDEAFIEAGLARWGEEQNAALMSKYQYAFPKAYQSRFSPSTGIDDLDTLNGLDQHNNIAVSLIGDTKSDDQALKLKLYYLGALLELSDIVPILENMGFRVVGNHHYNIAVTNSEPAWIHEITLNYASGFSLQKEVDQVQLLFQEAFLAIWQGEAENDYFNRLILGADLNWRLVTLFRTYARYLKQLGTLFSDHYIASVLCRHVSITVSLAELVDLLFNPQKPSTKALETARQELIEQIDTNIQKVININEDQVLSDYLNLILATLRTNFFQTDTHGNYKSNIALKLKTSRLNFAPQPRPEFEIYVYSPRMEAVHLRAGKIARGGIRWSDRDQDFRSEILGLMKAQQVKNSVIVPAGAKGGFIVKRSTAAGSNESLMEEGIQCYRLFINELLALTDNLSGNRSIKPTEVVCRDESDSYLVVAADKGTATFSDTANEISHRSKFWLEDAFASGGSYGYDHKAIGITAQGAWVAVQRHFRELGINVQKEPFTVLGIGDMGGDVFGNGMLRSESIRLVAAFNHKHIFIDPNPDLKDSWKERQRLFEKTYGWNEYDKSLISTGGGVFSRQSKLIRLSQQIRELLDISTTFIKPHQLIKAILKAKVDLLWNGGIGTYVKATAERHVDVSDKANDSLRISASELRCKVIGEGGNLGLTQLARQEYASMGRLCNTDFIDNVAGVDCSDHEVNIKILLNELVNSGELDLQARNQLLNKMTEEVKQLVLQNSYRQTLSISLSHHRRVEGHSDYMRVLTYLQEQGNKGMLASFMPDDTAIKEIEGDPEKWTKPQLAVMVSCVKVVLKQEILQTTIAEDPVVAQQLLTAFPVALIDKYGHFIDQHPLRNEIITNQLTNDIVNRMGFSFCQRHTYSVGSDISQIAKTYVTVMELFSIDSLWQAIEALDYKIGTDIQYQLFHQVIRLCRRAMRWFLRNEPDLKPNEAVARLGTSFKQITAMIVELLPKSMLYSWNEQKLFWENHKIPEEIATRVAAFNPFFMLPGLVTAALKINCPVAELVQFSFRLSDSLSLNRIMDHLISWQLQNNWHDLARETYVDNLEGLQRQLTIRLYKNYANFSGDAISAWMTAEDKKIKRLQSSIASTLEATPQSDLSMITVVFGELRDLINLSLHLD